MKRIGIILIVGLLLCAGAYYAPEVFDTFAKETPPAMEHLQLGGTSAAAIMVDSGWRTAYKMQKKLDVDYESIGSTTGIDRLIDGHYAIAFTHQPLTDAQRQRAKAKNGELIQVPVVLCSVVPIYNVKELQEKPPLKFTGEVLAKIFLGTIDTWNHADLEKLNPGVKLPPTKIAVVHRSDSSGTTFLFSEYLASVSPEWRTKVGKAKSVIEWPVGVGMPRTPKLVDYVRTTDGAIGYADLVHPYYGKISYGAVQSHDKKGFILAEGKHMTAAARESLPAIKDDLSFSLTDMAGSESYPISGAIWAVCYRKQPAKTGAEVEAFLKWIVHDGQQFTSAVYGALPEELVQRVDEKLKTLETDS